MDCSESIPVGGKGKENECFKSIILANNVAIIYFNFIQKDIFSPAQYHGMKPLQIESWSQSVLAIVALPSTTVNPAWYH